MFKRLLVLLATIGIAGAQVDTGTISGLVRDASGGGIPGVQVTLRDESTGLATGIVTNAAGLYVSPPLRAGTYVVEVRAKGFEAAAKRVQLDVSQRFEVDFDLAVGAVSETAPGPQQFGNTGRNILTGPGTSQADLSLFKDFFVNSNETRRLQFRAESFNVTNTPQFNNPASSIGSAGAGTVTAAGAPLTFQRTSREVQLALKLYF